MRPWILVFSALLLAPGKASPQGETTAFVNVAVLPMDRERILEDHTVLVRDGLIQEVAPSYRVQVPSGARVIDGQGLFLMPGLADMHVSLPGPGAPPEEVDDFLFLCLANDVTVVRGMYGSPNHIRLKEQTASGALLGPTIYAGSPPLNGENTQDAESAIARMTANRRAGYDLQTIRQGIRLEVWDSLAEAAHSSGYSFGGLVPDAVGLRNALSTGISTIEHLDGFLEEVVSDPVQARLNRGQAVPLDEMLASVEGRKVRAIAAHVRSSDAWVVPTLYLWENRFGPGDLTSMLSLPEMRYVPTSLRQAWLQESGSRSPTDPETAALLVEVRRRILRALTMAGVGVLMGTDSPQMFNVPGFSLRHELRSMEAAGLTPYEILVTGTRSVAEYAQRELLEPANFGTVVAGNRADLILLRSDPFQDLEALWDQEGVMVRGRWIPRDEIETRLAGMAERNER
jgi:imidazolonepropionase-like amidohydrolase